MEQLLQLENNCDIILMLNNEEVAVCPGLYICFAAETIPYIPV